MLELGSGPGDHTGFYVQRECEIVSVDARQDCLNVLQQRFPNVRAVLCDLNTPGQLLGLGVFDVIHCYGILYHLEDPAALLAYMRQACEGFAIVETCVMPDDGRRIAFVQEVREDCTQSSTGRGCRPTRKWVFEQLGSFFSFVYHTRTQPRHPEFPIDWKDLSGAPPLIRAVFVASKQPLNLPSLSPTLLDMQEQLDSDVGELCAPASESRAATLEAHVRELERHLEEKEQVIQELARAARERLELIGRLSGGRH